MLRQLKGITGRKLTATDGIVGRIKELHFTEGEWRVESLVVNTGNWLSGPDVLMPPSSIRTIHDSGQIEISLTRSQVESLPLASTREPVSHQLETRYHRYSEWIDQPADEAEPAWIPEGFPGGYADGADRRPPQNTASLIGYRVETRDGRAGSLDDFVFDDATWRIRYLVVCVRPALAGRKVLASTQQVKAIDWSHSSIHFDCGRDAILGAPEFDAGRGISRDYEQKVVSHYLSGGWGRASLAV